MDKSMNTIDTIARTCIAGRLRLINRVITNIYDKALRPQSLKISQGNILIMTEKMGIFSPVQVCDVLQIDISTLRRKLELMRKKGWLEDVPCEDARIHPFWLTASGKQPLRNRSIPDCGMNCWSGRSLLFFWKHEWYQQPGVPTTIRKYPSVH